MFDGIKHRIVAAEIYERLCQEEESSVAVVHESLTLEIFLMTFAKCVTTEWWR